MDEANLSIYLSRHNDRLYIVDYNHLTIVLYNIFTKNYTNSIYRHDSGCFHFQLKLLRNLKAHMKKYAGRKDEFYKNREIYAIRFAICR
jgi:hypothetical protein